MKKPVPSNIVPAFETFKKLASRYNRVPLCLAFQSDLETPLSAYLKLARGGEGFLLESVEKNEQVARFSIVGFSPSGTFVAKKGRLTERAGKKRTVTSSLNPLQAVKEKVASVRQAPLEGRRDSWEAWWGSSDTTRCVISRSSPTRSPTFWTFRTFT